MKQLLLVFAFAVAVNVSWVRSVAADPPPNVLFIAVDDLNDWVGCMGGHPQALTPNIDRLAARGVLFVNAHCAAPACTPSRAAVFSGQMPNHTGVWSNRHPRLSTLQPDAKQLPDAFAEAGYLTLATGKLSGDKKTRYDETYATEQRWSPFSRSAVEYTAKEQPSKGSRHPKHVLQDSLGRDVVLPLNRMPSDRAADKTSGESFDWGPLDVPDTDFGDTLITNWASEKLSQERKKPFFLGVGYYRPHIPLFAPARFFQRFESEPGILPKVKQNDLADLSKHARQWAIEPDTAGLHSTVVKHKQWHAAVEAYLACVTYVDHEIGRLVDTLDSSPTAKNTWIVLWSDHGWHLGEKEHWGKWTGWERSTRVPLIIVPPTNLSDEFPHAGSVCVQPVSLVDLYPTLAEVCKLPAPKALDGVSLVPHLRKPNQASKRSVVTMFNPGNCSVRNQRFRYIQYADGSEELYDMTSDLGEWTNLAGTKKFAREQSAFKKALQGYSPVDPVSLPNRIEPSQSEWYAKYRKQENVPRPSEQLINRDAEPNTEDGFTPLFNGQDLTGWTPRGGTCKFEVQGDNIVGTCVPGSQSTYLCTGKSDYANFIFSCDIKWDVDGNSGVMFRAQVKETKKNPETVFGPQAEMEGTEQNRGWSGGIYGQSCGGYFYPVWLKEHEAARKALIKDGWNRVTVSAQGNVVKSWLNGVPVSKWIDNNTYTQGFFGLQVHAGTKGKIRFKNLRVKALP